MVNSRMEAPAVAVMGGGGGTSGRSCAGCGGRIADRFLLFSMERYWHTRCLKCSCCHAQLGEYSTTCYSKGGMILCKNDYIRWAGLTGCRGDILHCRRSFSEGRFSVRLMPEWAKVKLYYSIAQKITKCTPVVLRCRSERWSVLEERKIHHNYGFSHDLLSSTISRRIFFVFAH